MKALLSYLLCAFFALFAVPNTTLALDVTLTTTLFQNEKGQTYIEVYSYFVATSVQYHRISNGQKLAAVRILYLIKQGDTIVKAEKFVMNSPVTDSLARVPNFLALQRIALPVGKYTLEATFTDDANPKNTKTTTTNLDITRDPNKVEMSEIELIIKAENSTDEAHKLFKSGALLEPYVLNYYPVGQNNLQFYTEAYRTKSVLKDDAFALRYYVLPASNTPNRVEKVEIIGNKRLNTGEVTPFLGSLDITQLPTGNYNLIVELRNRKMEIVAERKIFFQRSNPFLKKPAIVLSNLPLNQMFTNKFSKDSCDWSLSGVLPQVAGEEQVRVLTILKEGTVEQKRIFLFSFWTSRYPANAENAYGQYMTLVKELDDKYSSHIQKGHTTDRGRIWLKYGKPDDFVSRETEAGSSPYEIWTYNKISETQGVGKFIFYSPSLGANDYELLHSTVRTERQDPQWQRKIYKNAQTNDRDYINGTSTDDVYGGRRASDLFNDN